MTKSMNHPMLKPLGVSVCAFAVLLFGAAASPAQAPARRIVSAIDSSSRVTLTGSRPPRALAANDVGIVPADTRLQGMTLVFNRSAAQQADLDALITAQQDPSWPQFHQWLTPAQFGARFGMADSDIAAAENWLQQQGFTIDSVSNSRDRIHFSGSVAQANAAFSTELHYYRDPADTQPNAQPHMAPSSDISLPAALAPFVIGVANLSGFRLRSHLVPGVQPRFTSSQTGNHYMTPGDVATIYDINAAYNSGYTGTGQAIAIVGQSAIYTSDITNFQTAAGLPSKLPTILLEPGTGTSTVYASSGDEIESDLDIEYSGAIAKGAVVYFVYTGSANGYGALDALDYVVQNDLAPIISSSYGGCEPGEGATNYTIYNSDLQMAAAQGETVVAAAGDAGSSDCYGEYTGTGSTANNEQLAVDFPASSQYVTALGGTEFPVADTEPTTTAGSNSATYWTAANGSDVISSAKSYIPEQVWNDDSSTVGLASGGGGVSIYTARPSWQANTVPGISAISGTYRLVPDISLDASPSPLNAPYAICTSDTKDWETGQENSCNSGFRDSYSGDLTVVGGTSVAAPIFAGMVALINQAKGYTAGQGLVNPTLYTLASIPATYQSAFHDIQSGGNTCLAGANYCSGLPLTDYASTIGYDEASGLGSVDLNNLLTAWPVNTVVSGSNFTISNASATVTTPGTNATANFTVTPVAGFTGTVAFRIYSTAPVAYTCFSIPNASISGTTAVTATVTISTNVSSCGTGTIPLVITATGGPAVASAQPAAPARPRHNPAPLAAATAGLLCLAFFSRRGFRLRSKLARAGMALGLLAVMALSGLGLSGCSNGASGTTTTTTITTTVTTPAGGPYTITVVGYNPSNTAQSATATLTLTVQ
jgi:subtilase family serine protease